MKFFVQKRLVPFTTRQLYNLASEYESGNQIRGDDWDSNEGPPFQLLNNGIPATILNGYHTEYRLHVGAKTRDLVSIPICDKTKKQIREGKFQGHQGWKGQLFFEVDIMNAVTLKHEHPIEYELLWTRSSNHWKFPRYHKNLGFPSKDLDGSSIVQEEVCRLFENEETPRKVRAYFQGFFPPGYGNQYSFDRIKEYIRCQSMLCVDCQ